MGKTEKLMFMLGLVLTIAFALYLMIQEEFCNRSGGTYVRGLWGMECIHSK